MEQGAFAVTTAPLDPGDTHAHRYDVRPTDEASRRRPARRTGRLLALASPRCWCSRRSPRPPYPSRGSRPTTRRPTAARTRSPARRSCRRGCRRSTRAAARWASPAPARTAGSPSTRRAARSTGRSTSAPRGTGPTSRTSSAKLFATDAEGNTDALARRMGIMYLIWNDHIYSSYYGFRARDYKACKVLSTCGDTLRHRNHVHISLSRAGGNGTTSWYTGATTVPAIPDRPDRPDGPDDRPAPAGRGPVGAAGPEDQGRHPRPAEAEVRHGRALAEGRREDHRLQAAQGIRLQGDRLRPVRLRHAVAGGGCVVPVVAHDAGPGRRTRATPSSRPTARSTCSSTAAASAPRPAHPPTSTRRP